MKKPNSRRRPPLHRVRTVAKPLFPLGKLLATRGALDLLDRSGVDAVELLYRHQRGDWGDVPPEDAEMNKFALLHSLRIVSSYQVSAKEKVVVITEADHVATTILRAAEA
jgi:hypothetical protein